jgi:hypothetical protein
MQHCFSVREKGRTLYADLLFKAADCGVFIFVPGLPGQAL